MPSDDVQANYFEETRNILRPADMRITNIHPILQEGYECLHNLNYWHGGEYIGLGTAAASHLGRQTI